MALAPDLSCRKVPRAEINLGGYAVNQDLALNEVHQRVQERPAPWNF